MAESSGQIDTVMQEKRLFPPPKEFAARARIKSLDEYQKLWDQAALDPPKFWADLARDELHWFQPFEKPLVWKEPFAEWFVGGTTNVSRRRTVAFPEMRRHRSPDHRPRRTPPVRSSARSQ